MTRRQAAAIGVLIAVGALVAAALVTPVPGDPDALTLFGQPFGNPCPFLVATGHPCPSCGMTRSWVWAVRGDLATAARFNAAGVLLLAGVQLHGAARLVELLGQPLPKLLWPVAVASGILFLVVWVGGWLARLAGYYPLA